MIRTDRQPPGRPIAGGVSSPQSAFTDSPSQVHARLLLLALVLAILGSAYLSLHDSEYRTTAEFTAAMEMVGAIIGLLTGACFISRFYTLGNRVHLLVGLAFFVSGGGDFVLGFLDLAKNHDWLGLSAAALQRALPGTYAAGRAMTAGLLLLAPFLPNWMRGPHRPRRETIWVTLAVLLVSATGTAVVVGFPFPDLVRHGGAVGRLLDLGSAAIFVAALVLFLHEYRRSCDRMLWWLALAIGINAVSQVTMAFSQALYDPMFIAANVYRILGYAAPLLGFSFYQLATIVEIQRAEDELRDSEGRLRQIITDLKRAEEDLRAARDGLELRVRERTAELANAVEELKQERALLHALMDNLPHNIYFKDRNSRFLRINRAMARFFGLRDAREAAGKTDCDFFTEEHARQAMEDEREILRSGRAIVDKEEKETWPDGHASWAATTKLPLLDEEGQVVGTFGISRDITEKKQAEEALCAAKEAAEAASRAKSAFLANMSHEIRTPMNAILGMTELVLENSLTAQQREFLTAVRESGESLLAIINDILDFSKIEAGKLQIELAPFNLLESLGDTMKSLAVRAHAKGLELACRIAPEIPQAVVGDCTRLRQVVINLVGNAIKFTEAGEVVLEVRREAETEDGPVLHFAVRDTGIGIPEEKLAVIFEAFEQADAGTTRRYGGTGLGLAISRCLTELMEGRIWVESRVGCGSTFHFTAKFGHAGPQPDLGRGMQPAVLCGTFDAITVALDGTAVERETEICDEAASPQIRPLRILLAEDSPVNQKLAIGLLERHGHRIVVASHGKEAVSLLATQPPFDLVLMDVQMPKMDGYEATAAIRRREKSAGGHIPIVAMTAHAMRGDRERCLESGMDGYIAKPIRAKELFRTIEEVMSKPAASEPVPMPPEGEFDWSGAMEAVQGDEDLLKVVVEAMIEECPLVMELVRTAISKGDASALRMNAHRLKGAVRYFSSSKAFEAAYRLENMGKEGALEGVEDAFAALQVEITKLMPILINYLRRGDGPGPGSA